MTCSIRLKRWTDVLLAIRKTKATQCYCERLCRILRCSRTHIREIAKMLLNHKLVKVIPYKNIKRLALTKRGEKVTSSLASIKQELIL